LEPNSRSQNTNMYKAIVEAIKEFKENKNSEGGSGSTTPTHATENHQMFFANNALKKTSGDNLRYIINFTHEMGEETNKYT